MNPHSRASDRAGEAGSAPPPSQACAPGVARPPVLDSGELLRGRRTVEIHHNGELYRLQATRNGKLILTK